MRVRRLIPRVGDQVLYLHREDGKSYPALVLEVEQVSDDQSPLDEIRCHLQIFRPRANFWAWAVEGNQPNQWSYSTVSVPNYTSSVDLNETTLTHDHATNRLDVQQSEEA